jgi:Protein of unknown function (DUF3574)
MSLLVEQALAPKVAQGGRRAAIAAAATLSAVTGMGSASAGGAEACAAPTTAMQQVEMYFGSSVKGAPAVTPAAWSQFLASEVTPKFVDGLTVFDASGQWRSGDGQVYREATHVVLILYKADATTDGKIEAIRGAYKKQFHQENAPVRVDSTVCAEF